MAPRTRPVQEIADRLHSAAVRLLRRIRQTDATTGLSPARLSILSVLRFAGPRTLGELARAEQVRPPTMSNLVSGLERDGLVRRSADRTDGRLVRISVSGPGDQILQRARKLRLDQMEEWLGGLTHRDLATLDRAATIIEKFSERSRGGARAISGR